MKHEEYAIQCAIIKQYRLAGMPDTFLFHPFNKASSPREGARAKAMGVIPGVPDLIGCIDGRFYALEVKTEKGYLSENQQVCREALWDAGASCDVGFGLEECINRLKDRGFL